MALTQAEVDICCRAADRIGANIFTLANQATDVVGAACNRHYEKLRDSLQRSYDFNFTRARAALSIIKTLTLNTQPQPSAWAVGDTITGLTSGTSAEILEVTSDSEYVVSDISGDFTDGETITNATVETVYRDGVAVERDGETVYWFDDSDTEQVNCATGYPVVATDAPDFEWTYQYLLPDDYVRFRSLKEEDDGTTDPSDRHTIEGKRLLTNFDSASLRYVRKITDPDDFDELFVETLELRLALAIMPIVAGTKTSDLRAELRDELKLAEGRCRLVSAQENNTTGYENFNNARYKS